MLIDHLPPPSARQPSTTQGLRLCARLWSLPGWNWTKEIQFHLHAEQKEWTWSGPILPHYTSTDFSSSLSRILVMTSTAVFCLSGYWLRVGNYLLNRVNSQSSHFYFHLGRLLIFMPSLVTWLALRVCQCSGSTAQWLYRHHLGYELILTCSEWICQVVDYWAFQSHCYCEWYRNCLLGLCWFQIISSPAALYH